MKKDYKTVEKVWLICVVIFFFLYNLPGVPEFGDARGALIHGAITVGLIWIACYAGLYAVYKLRPPLEKPRTDEEIALAEEMKKEDKETK